MPITRANIEEITESDLVELREHQVAESLSIDYKRVIDAETEDGKRKLLKHASSFANSAGGHLVIGVAEEDGIPTELVGLSGDLDVDAEKRRLENLFRDCLEPRIVGLKVQPIPLGNGRRVLIIRVPKSWNPPHAVLYKGSRKYFVRNSAGAHEASVEELRAMFTAGAALLDRIREFRRTRLKAIHSTETPIRIGDKGRLVLHLIPFSSFGLNSFLDPRKMQGAHLPPIFHSGFSGRYNLDGFLTTSGKEPDRAGYVQVFRNGIIESAAGDICADGNLYAQSVEDEVCTKLEGYMDALSKAGISPPIAVLLSGVRLHGATVIGIPNPTSIEIKPLHQPEPLFPEVILEQFGTIEEFRRELKPLFDALWNAGGYPGSKSYGPDGTWVRRT